MVFRQTIATIPGLQYELSFFLGTYTRRWGGPPESISASAAGASRTFTVSTTSTASTWTPFSMLFVATSANTPVTLTGSAGFEYIGLDNVSVEQVGQTTVPEPATYALMALGLGLLAAARRRPKV